MQQEIYNNGPISVEFMVYSDFMQVRACVLQCSGS